MRLTVFTQTETFYFELTTFALRQLSEARGLVSLFFSCKLTYTKHLLTLSDTF